MKSPAPGKVSLVAAEAALRNDPNLEGFPPDQLTQLLGVADWRRIPAGTRLFSAGETRSPVHAVACGFVAMESSLAIPDLPLVTLMQGPFWVVGRPQVHGRVRLTTATARTPLLVATIGQERFDALAAQDPTLHNFKSWVAGNLFWDVMEALTDALIPDNRHRVLSTLLRIAGRKQRGDEPAIVPISQNELSAITNLSRQTCGELLRSLEHAGSIRLGYREIEIVRPQQLRALIAATDR